MSNLVFLEPNRLDAVPIGMKCVYVLESETGLVKIGVTREYLRRKRTLETQSGFVMKNEYLSKPLSNYSDIERLAHERFFDGRKLGEWFEIDFSKAVNAVESICDECGDTTPPAPRSCDVSNIFRLPTAMEEEKIENPILYNWLVENNLEIYYDSDSKLMVRGEGFEDMPFRVFAAITKSVAL